MQSEFDFISLSDNFEGVFVDECGKMGNVIKFEVNLRIAVPLDSAIVVTVAPSIPNSITLDRDWCTFEKLFRSIVPGIPKISSIVHFLVEVLCWINWSRDFDYVHLRFCRCCDFNLGKVIVLNRVLKFDFRWSDLDIFNWSHSVVGFFEVIVVKDLLDFHFF